MDLSSDKNRFVLRQKWICPQTIMDLSADNNGFVLRQKWICPKTRKDLSADKDGFVRRQEWIYPHTRLDVSIILSLDLINSIRPLSIRFHDVVYMLLQHDIMGMCTNTYFAHFWSTLTKLSLSRQTKDLTSLTLPTQAIRDWNMWHITTDYVKEIKLNCCTHRQFKIETSKEMMFKKSNWIAAHAGDSRLKHVTHHHRWCQRN